MQNQFGVFNVNLIVNDTNTDTDSRFWGFGTVCRISMPTAFREPLWVPSSMVIG